MRAKKTTASRISRIGATVLSPRTPQPNVELEGARAVQKKRPKLCRCVGELRNIVFGGAGDICDDLLRFP